MSNPNESATCAFDRPGTYRIRVIGSLDPDWSDRLGGMYISTRNEEDQGAVTSLVGTLSDQAALSGILNTLYEMHYTLLSVKFLGEEESIHRREQI
ncbi:hypothetical protein D3OALGA1CA_2928 [Olavius algarvensis associated proteobacterium Delta 3]|nr:hypothetical protein D3OALGB2SA_1409 [Olavius algarvensis associated proteobacterium Delta 3]CAB5126362.1 hypothetical protein D3OALGA1CA_2928 [Olavius algarvensis associated proteobacterium Delta 3]